MCMWALAFIEIRPAGSPASWEPHSLLSLASQVQVVYLSWSKLQGHAQASIFLSFPQDLLPLLKFSQGCPGSDAGQLQVSPSGGATGGAEPFLSGPASATSWVTFPFLS